MKRLIMIFLVSVLSLSGCVFYTDSIVGNGKTITTDYSFEGFTQISSNFNFDVTFEQSDDYVVEITCEENILKYLQITKLGDKLSVGLKNSNNYRNLRLRANIKAPDITMISANGSSDIKIINDLITEHDMFIELNGSSRLTGNMKVRDMDVKLNGASSMTGTLNSQTLTASINGGSKLKLDGKSTIVRYDSQGGSNSNMYNYIVDDAVIDLKGASTLEITINKSISLNASGASKLYYKGNANIEEIELSGESRIIQK